MMLIIKKFLPPFEDACLEKYKYLMTPPVIWIYEALQAIILKSGSSGESVGKYSNLHPVRV